MDIHERIASISVAPLEPPIVVEHREQLIYLLRQASELEHAIMCEYLFAAFSLKQRVDEGLTEEQKIAVDRWRKVVLEVAKQEMLHLALVQNLLTAVGAAPYLSRPDLPTPPGHFPPGMRIQLIPFGERALRHFLYLERPEGMALDDPEAVLAVARAAAIMEDADIVPRAQTFATVGHLYRAIDIGFAWLVSKLGADTLFIGPPEAQATPGSFGWKELVPVTDLASAHAAIDTIVEQGEGVSDEWRTAHFGRFLDVFDEYMAMKAEDPAFEPARPALAGRARFGNDDEPVISDSLTAKVADLFNVANEVILLTLARYFASTDETAEQRATLADVAVELMFGAIKPLGQLLTQMPFGPTHPGRTAGPTFELFYRSGYLLPHRQAAWALIAERLRQAGDFARALEGAPAAVAKIAVVFDKFAARLMEG
ncbi:MAG: ferritin-like protein [Chloroflexi bacterium]|nr:ferritin-like protein [Chloroflexota bacterium]